MITALTSTVSDIVISSKGLIAADGVTRGALVVKITITYDDLSTKDILSALKVRKLYIDFFFPRLKVIF